MSEKYILALDQGTSSTRALLVRKDGSIAAIAGKPLSPIYPKSGWVEHNPIEIWNDQYEVIWKVKEKAGISANQIEAIGITNQRETTVIWEADSGKPIYNAIVWQDKRSVDLCEKLQKDGLETHIRQKTGLVVDAYFSGTKISWLLEHVEGAREKAIAGKLRFGTIDSWLVWNLTYGKHHVTDHTNASRTMLFDINTRSWDPILIEALNVPDSLLPEVLPSASHFGDFKLDGHNIPILGIAGDQQAALFGQHCTEAGMAKNTYGTGCFMLMHTGDCMHISDHGLLTTLTCQADGSLGYALEGSIFIAGAAIQWLRDGLGIIDEAADSEYFAGKAGEHEDLYVVPAFSGLGAPHWDMYAKGAIMGLTRDSNRNHIIRATLESIAYQTRDVLEAMSEDTGLDLTMLKVDGGGSVNNYLMQFQADILNVPVERPAIVETTALGIAYLAGIKSGFWTAKELKANREIEQFFTPGMPRQTREQLYKGWLKAVERVKA